MYSWPALQGWDGVWKSFQTSRAVFGKVHRAPTDYRWIAWSEGFDPRPYALEQELGLGVQENPSPVVCWRSKSAMGRPMAVRYYPSNAVDAGGRPAGAESQVLAAAFDVPDSMPAAALAFLLLPEAPNLNEEVWWEQHRDRRWPDSDFFLTIPREERWQIEAGADPDLRPRLRKGVEELFKALGCGEAYGSENDGDKRLTNFYEQLLAGSALAVLKTPVGQLSPLAMAALLLPLERRRADQLRLAGGLLSPWFAPERLGNSWDAVICGPEVRFSAEAAKQAVPFSSHDSREAARMVQMLHDGLEFDGDSAPELSPGGKLFWNFLRSKERSLTPGLYSISKFKSAEFPIVTDELERNRLLEEMRLFFNKYQRMEIEKQHECEDARRQLDVKGDLVRALFLVLCPGKETRKQVGQFSSDRVPPLFLLAEVDEPGQMKVVEEYGPEFVNLAEQSNQVKIAGGAVSRVRNCLDALARSFDSPYLSRARSVLATGSKPNP
ncbi:MAG: hypothetical protein WCF54_05255 [Terracidiphilus sp.]